MNTEQLRLWVGPPYTVTEHARANECYADDYHCDCSYCADPANSWKQVMGDEAKNSSGERTESPLNAPGRREVFKAREIVEAAIKECYEPAQNPSAEGTQQLDQEWLMPLWGCDTLDHLRDSLVHRIYRALAADVVCT